MLSNSALIIALSSDMVRNIKFKLATSFILVHEAIIIPAFGFFPVLPETT